MNVTLKYLSQPQFALVPMIAQMYAEAYVDHLFCGSHLHGGWDVCGSGVAFIF